MNTNRPIVLVTGGRFFSDRTRVDNALTYLRLHFGQDMAICQGGATGADTLAQTWAFTVGAPCITVPAQWPYYASGAGAIRNKWMLDYLHIVQCCAFPGNSGTRHMRALCKSAGVPIYEG